MGAQELIALYRFSNKNCQTCKRIIGKYEKSLNLSIDDLKLLEKSILNLDSETIK